jgi:hypothetical protein
MYCGCSQPPASASCGLLAGALTTKAAIANTRPITRTAPLMPDRVPRIGDVSKRSAHSRWRLPVWPRSCVCPRHPAAGFLREGAASRLRASTRSE